MNIHHSSFQMTGPRGNSLYGGRTSVQGANFSASRSRVALDIGSSGATMVGRQLSLNQTGQSLGSLWQSYGQPALGEKESFDSRIWGDPHFEMNGTVNGEAVDSKFDNHDLGNRTQIAGAGFKLETETVPWGDGGAAVVGSSTVSTGFGRNQDQVTVNADGTVLVNGEQVSMEAGQTSQLNRTSSLTMNDDGTYTVSSRNGKVTNTFQANEHAYGDYLNIDTSVDNVQTVGWFQQQTTA
jgi:uncharacterized Zn-binding protein involved in type VI secretion